MATIGMSQKTQSIAACQLTGLVSIPGVALIVETGKAGERWP